MQPSPAQPSPAQWRSAVLIAVLTAAFLLAMLPASASSQPALRTNFVFNVYVDPQHGDDRLAGNQTWVFNPAPTGQHTPLSDHPAAVPPHESQPWTTLEHASYPFRTISAASAYIQTISNAHGGFLPWTLPNSRVVEAVVIHCLPGLYGPHLTSDGPDKIDPASGLPWNGETFPIQLDDRVSLQGTSALNTIIDGRGQYHSLGLISTSGFMANIPPAATGWRKSFIDGFTIRGARNGGSGGPPAGAGIVVYTSALSHTLLSISNCFIVDNTVGIALEYNSIAPLLVVSPLIANNTIAWNRVGVYAYDAQLPSTATVSYARPRLLNNVIDADDPYNRWNGLTNTSCLEGIDVHDLTVERVIVGSTTSFIFTDFNAYQAVHRNRGIGPSFGWPPVTVRNPTLPYVPRQDITPFTFTPSRLLFVRDLFVGVQSADRSPHDLRLAPDLAPFGHENVLLNPLVNNGIDTKGGAQTLRMWNWINDTQTPPITDPPGLKGPGNQAGGNDTEFASMHGWDWDGEGYGNARIFPRRGGFAPPTGFSTEIDIGADEMGSLVMAGYIHSTTIFSRLVPQTSISAHTEIFFVDVPAPAGPGTYPKPYFSSLIGGRATASPDYRWWRWAQGANRTDAAVVAEQARFGTAPPFGQPYYNYTIGEASSDRNSQKAGLFPAVGAAGVNWQPFARNLECDISPHLMSDWHAVWAAYFSALAPQGDEFAANPWHHHVPVSPILWSTVVRPRENHFLYYKPTHSTLPSAVLEGTINPPGTWIYGGVGATGGFIGVFPTAPFTYTGTPTFTVDASGLGDAALGPDIAPNTSWLGLRHNCELFVNGSFGTSNLQSFLTVNGEPPPEAPAALIGPRRHLPAAKQLAAPAVEDYERSLKRCDFSERKEP